ncbi:MAG: chitobiase/beta-hexosaminidase C-terminal domain-containing protein [Spirochaetales bacterium]|nr:chitobiase/beta-hexosaminidase C-terminal domain-containing protein [Spirochaetales bacterium]
MMRTVRFIFIFSFFIIFFFACNVSFYNPFTEDTYIESITVPEPSPTPISELEVAIPVMNPAGGTYDSDQDISLTCSTAGAVIRFTTNGSDPGEESDVYSVPIPVTGNGTSMTIKAYAVKTGMLDSGIRTEEYTINYEQVSTPSMNVPGGTYHSDQNIVISCGTSDATIHYTTNGDDPDESSPEYISPVSVAGHNTTMTIKAYAVKAGMLDSTIRTEEYTIQYPTILSITSSTENGTYGIGDDITITVNFSQQMTLAGGTLDITLDTGKTVSITAFGPADSASGTYTVGTNESSSDLDATGIVLNGGTLRNSENTDAIINLPGTTIKTGSDIVVDGYIPAITGFSLTSGSPATDHFITFTLDGSDSGTGITYWMINESAVKPAYNDPGWVTSKPDKYTLSPGYGTKSVYAWAKDGASNVSNATGNSTFDVVMEYTGASSWTFEKNTAGSDNPKGMTIDYNDNVYVIGMKTNTTEDWQIIKLAPDGTEDTVNWDKAFDWYEGNDSAQAVVTDSENNVYVSGWFTDGSDILWGLKKYTTNGSEVWTDEWNYSTGDDEAQGMAVDSNDNIYVVGLITNGSGDYDWWMKKYDPDGNEDTVDWDFGFDNGYGNDTAIAVAVDSSDNVYIAGRATNSSGNNDIMVRKYTANGSFVWSRESDNAGKYDRAYSIVIDSNDNVYIAGFVTQSDDDMDWIIKKYDSNGTEDTTNWDKVIDYGTDDVAWGITTDSSNNVYVGGRLMYSDYEWTVIKFNSSGTELYRDVISNTGTDWCRAIFADSMDYVYGAGGAYRSGTDSDWFVKKYTP